MAAPTHGPTPTFRFSHHDAVVGIATDVDEHDATRAAERLAKRYASVPGLAGWRGASVWLPQLRAVVAVTGTEPPALVAPCTVVWGCPVGATGPATDAELGAALDSPTSAAALGGLFVLVRVLPGSLRVVTSADFVHTLRRSGTCFATRAAGALALAGRRLVVDPQHVVEAVVWQAVVADGELLADVEACEEATVVDVRPGTTEQWSWAPLGERLARQEPPSPEGFRAQVGELLARFARVPGARLTVTGGRDSTLAASCLAEHGSPVPTFTMGNARFADARAGRAVADRLGWSHEAIDVRDSRGRRSRLWPAGSTAPGRLSEWVVRHAPWGEGLAHPRDALVGRMGSWSSSFPAITGHAGELGRAYFYGQEPDRDPVELMLSRGTAAHLPAPAREAFGDVIRHEVRLAASIDREAEALDLALARRLRSWMDHGWLPDSAVGDVLPAMMAPGVVRALLDVPRADRCGSRFFDQALTAWRPDVWEAAVRETARTYRPWRVLGPLNPYLMRNDWPLLERLLAELEPDGLLVRDLIGQAWWQGAVEAARRDPWARGPVWNAIAVEAVHRCDR